MQLNWLIILSTGIIPLIVGGIWYGPLFGKTWMKVAGMSEEKIAGSNMLVIFGTTLVMGIFLATGLAPIVIHQMGAFAALQNVGVAEPGSEAHAFFADFISKYGGEFRTFRHGALHGFITGLLIFFSVITTNALFERKGFTYIMLNTGFWTICAMIMGGIICAFA
jgi:hypothetical protein